MKNIIYFFYFLKKTNYNDLMQDLDEINKDTKKLKIQILIHMIKISLKYGASFKDYAMFKFYQMDEMIVDSYVTTGRLYEFYRSLNDKRFIDYFRNKKRFNETFSKYIGREYLFIDEVDEHDVLDWLSKRECIIAKPNYGVSGVGIEKIIINDWTRKLDILEHLKRNRLSLIEDCIQQHHRMSEINSSSVNSIRIVTVQYNNQIDLISAVLRIGVSNHVDNFSAGGIAAPIDTVTGKVFRPAITKRDSETFYNHPVTNTQIVDFIIPYWEETVRMICEAAMVVPEVRTVGWDVAITEKGPLIIEGNDNWNKNVFQIPYGEGRQYILDRYTNK